jgi:hypothetical protein
MGILLEGVWVTGEGYNGNKESIKLNISILSYQFIDIFYKIGCGRD